MQLQFYSRVAQQSQHQHLLKGPNLTSISFDSTSNTGVQSSNGFSAASFWLVLGCAVCVPCLTNTQYTSCPPPPGRKSCRLFALFFWQLSSGSDLKSSFWPRRCFGFYFATYIVSCSRRLDAALTPAESSTQAQSAAGQEATSAGHLENE